jgi:hypothetical protein
LENKNKKFTYLIRPTFFYTEFRQRLSPSLQYLVSSEVCQQIDAFFPNKIYRKKTVQIQVIKVLCLVGYATVVPVGSLGDPFVAVVAASSADFFLEPDEDFFGFAGINATICAKEITKEKKITIRKTTLKEAG